MKLKSRDNYFMKFIPEADQAEIRLLNQTFQVTMTKEKYDLFFDTVKAFLGRPSVIPEQWLKSKERLSCVKAAMQMNMVYEYKEQPSRVSDFVQQLLESRYPNQYDILEKLHRTTFTMKGLKNKDIALFFQENGLIGGSETVNLYFNEAICEAPYGSLCVIETTYKGLVIFQKIDDDANRIFNDFVHYNGTRLSKLGEKTFPLHIFLAVIESFFGSGTKHIFKFINPDGSVDEVIAANDITKTHSYFERGTKRLLSGLELISTFEKTIKRKFIANFSYNNVHFSENNQYAVSQYRLSHLHNGDETACYLGVGETYVEAATRAIQYGFGELLTKVDSRCTWISDLDETAYYTRAMLHFLPEKKIENYVLSGLPDKTQSLKRHVENWTGQKLNVILCSMLNERAGKVTIVNEHSCIMYESPISVDIDGTINEGLHYVLMQHLNQKADESSPRTFCMKELLRRKLVFFPELDLPGLQNKLKVELAGRKIREEIWFFETGFDEAGLHIGRFVDEEEKRREHN